MRLAFALVLLAACGGKQADPEAAFDASTGAPPTQPSPVDASVPPSALQCAGNALPSAPTHSSPETFFHFEPNGDTSNGDFRVGMFRDLAPEVCGERGVYFVKDPCGIIALAVCAPTPRGGPRCLYLEEHENAPEDPAGLYFDGSGQCQDVRRVSFTLDTPATKPGDLQRGRVIFVVEAGSLPYSATASFTACAIDVPVHTCR